MIRSRTTTPLINHSATATDFQMAQLSQRGVAVAGGQQVTLALSGPAANSTQIVKYDPNTAHINIEQSELKFNFYEL